MYVYNYVQYSSVHVGLFWCTSLYVHTVPMYIDEIPRLTGTVADLWYQLYVLLVLHIIWMAGDNK